MRAVSVFLAGRWSRDAAAGALRIHLTPDTPHQHAVLTPHATADRAGKDLLYREKVNLVVVWNKETKVFRM
jgi:hypothetical protein